MTAVPSLLRRMRRSVRVKASRSAAASGQACPCEGGGSRHGGTGEEAGKRRVVDLAVPLAVIVLLHPGLRRLVEPSHGEIVDALEHGHQPALDRSPEDLLLAVLIGRIRQRGLMNDAEP